MKRNSRKSQPQVIEVRKPLRPTSVNATRQPIKVTKPITFGGPTLPARVVR